LLHTADVVQRAGFLVLCFVVLFVGEAVLATAVTVGVLVADGVEPVTVGVAAVDGALVVGGALVAVGVPEALLGPDVGVATGVVTGPDPVAENVRSTQYWLAFQLLVGKELVAP